MGRLIEQLAPEYGFERAREIRQQEQCGRRWVDAAKRCGALMSRLNFPRRTLPRRNIQRLAAAGVNTAVGTTGWLEHLPVVREAVTQSGTGVVWAPNFSVGVSLFIQAVAYTAALFASQQEYAAWGWEIHHSAKKDAPSGTLRKLAEEMRAGGYARAIELSSNRAGAHPGTHEIGFDSLADTITLRHTARSRDGFARGALQAARWVAGKKGLFEFREILAELGEGLKRERRATMSL